MWKEARAIYLKRSRAAQDSDEMGSQSKALLARMIDQSTVSPPRGTWVVEREGHDKDHHADAPWFRGRLMSWANGIFPGCAVESTLQAICASDLTAGSISKAISNQSTISM